MEDKNRFTFGKNWWNFLQNLKEESIKEAETSLTTALKCKDLKGKAFLDIGSGSGLFSLSAYRLGANVFSFDYDQQSVNCTKFLQEKYEKEKATNTWEVTQGSILDKNFTKDLKKSDIVYSWGVLHHTGNMYQAFGQVARLVNDNGYLFISIYNDQGGASKRWKWIKKKYNKSGPFVKFILIVYTLLRQWSITFIKDFLKTGNPFKNWINYKINNRGMSAYHDLIDWVGGYPFEVAKPEEIFNYFYNMGFRLIHLKTCCGGIGCNEFIFHKTQ